MKNIIKSITVLLLIASIACSLIGCDSGHNRGGTATGSSDIDVSTPQFAFVAEEDYDPNSTVIDYSKKWNDLRVDTNYYLYVKFKITSARDNDGQSLIDLNITFDAIDIMDGTIEEVGTGNVQTLTFKDAQTGNVGKTTTASFKIPAWSDESKEISMTVKLRPVTVGQSHILIGYDYDPDGNGTYKLLGSDGHTKNLQIKEVQIDAPVLTVDEANGNLVWNHVKNADYYMFFIDGVPITDFNDEPLTYSAEGYTVGGSIVYSIAQYLYSGYQTICIRAYSQNENIKQSNYSNSVSYTW